MYPPASSGIKTQTFTRQSAKARVFHQSSNELNPRKLEGGKNTGSNGRNGERYDRGNNNNSNQRWNNSSTGSTSPSISSPLSRTSSSGSNNDERPGSAIARQGAVIAQQTQAVHLPTNIVAPPKNSAQPSLSSHAPCTAPTLRSSKSFAKPFNHKEVVNYMNRAFLDAKKAIDAGHGKVYEPREHETAVDFKPFDWEEFWKVRKMRSI